MKTKTRKTGHKATPKQPHGNKFVPGRRFGWWLGATVLLILTIGFQIVRANVNGGLALNTPNGSLQREAQLDSVELQQQTNNDQSYDNLQMVNAQGYTSALGQMAEVIDNADN
jgi:hypothetical protein